MKNLTLQAERQALEREKRAGGGNTTESVSEPGARKLPPLDIEAVFAKLKTLDKEESS